MVIVDDQLEVRGLKTKTTMEIKIHCAKTNKFYGGVCKEKNEIKGF